MSIEIREERRQKNWIVLIDPFFDPKNTRRGFRTLVTVSSSEDFSFEVRDLVWQRAGISWVSLGAVGSDAADAFQKALTIAVEKARIMDAEHGFDSGIEVKGGATSDVTPVKDNTTEGTKGR